MNNMTMDQWRAKLEGISKRFSLNFKKENITNLRKRFTPKQMRTLKAMMECLDEIYPDNYDIQFKFKAVFGEYTNQYGNNHVLTNIEFKNLAVEHVYIIIRFPELKLTNSEGANLMIKDLFFMIQLEPSGAQLLITELRGTRSTISTEEYSAGYAHSHLPNIYFSSSDFNPETVVCKYHSFCLGNGQEIELLYEELNSQQNEEPFNKDSFSLFLLQIQTYLEWESIEGVPFNRISYVINKTMGASEVSYEEKKQFLAGLKATIKVGGLTPNLDWKLKEGQYEIVDNEKLEDFLVTYAKLRYPHLLLHKDSSGNYFKESGNPIIRPGLEDYWLPFRNEKIHFKVEYRETTKKKLKEYVHPKIKEYVRKKFETIVKASRIKETGIRRLSTSYNY